MSEIEVRAIVRDTYNFKRYEVIRHDRKTLIYDYDLGRLLEKEEIEILQNELTED